MDFNKLEELNEGQQILQITMKDGTKNETVFEEMKLDMGFLCIRSACEDPNTGKWYWVEQAINMDEIATFVVVHDYKRS